jgi:uncharacterized integral membrane protein (TIGR00697 family)
MTLPLILFWALVVSATTLGAAWYARRYAKADALVALYVTLVIAANLVAAKIIGFDLGFVTLFAPSATLIFSVTFLLTDIVNERFGRQETVRMIWIAVAAQLLFLLFSYIALWAQGAPFFINQAAFDTVFSQAPRIAAAGLITFLISETFDAYVFAWFHKRTGGNQLWMRNTFSSLPAMIVDSALFVALAFSGTGAPLISLMIGLTTIKWIVGIIDIPFMYAARAVMR